MAQHDMEAQDAPGLTWRTDVNHALAALATLSSGPIEPSSPKAGMLWLDTSVLPNGALKMRNQANASWIPLQFAEPPVVRTGLPGAVMTFPDAVSNVTDSSLTIFPVGALVVGANATANSRTANLPVRLHATVTLYEVNTGTGAALAGAWLHRALINIAVGNYYSAMQRVS